ncbi:MAG: CheR family methyltransferase, partial [Planctomycetia bacterium]
FGDHSLGDAVRRRMVLLGLTTSENYLERLFADAEEVRRLGEETSIPESWFFRDREPFRFVAEWGFRRSTTLPADQPLRVLSVPCAAGEEPFSIVMTLLDVGVAPDRLMVDAVDLSRRALENAARGVYSANAFRGDVAHYRDLYFDQRSDGFELTPDVRRHVRFLHGDILDAPRLDLRGPYDLVFCRNLMIYRTAVGRRRLLAEIDLLLAADGVLVLGHADMLPTDADPPFHAVDPAAFAFSRMRPTPPPMIRPPSSARAPSSRPATAGPGSRTMARPKTAPLGETFAAPTSESVRKVNRPADIDTIRWLADQGRLDEAAVACHQYLAAGPDADGFALLGVVETARGRDDQAVASLIKAAYLDPNHGVALTYLALLADRRGDRASAARYRERAQSAEGS